MAPISVLPSRQQRRVLAEIEMAIKRAERTRVQQLVDIKHLAEGGKGTAGALVWLRRTDDHLGCLRRSRQALLSGEAPPA